MIEQLACIRGLEAGRNMHAVASSRVCRFAQSQFMFQFGSEGKVKITQHSA